MMNEAIVVKKKKNTEKLQYLTFSVRVKEETLRELDRIVEQSNHSRNEIINVFLEHCVKHYKVEE